MMLTNKLSSYIKQWIPETNLPALVSALRQDPLIWVSLQDSAFLDRLLPILRENPGKLSPAAITLASIDPALDISTINTQPLQPLEKGLRQKAAKFFENLSKGETLFSNVAPSIFSEPDKVAESVLPNAGLLALALRERFRLLGSWEGLKNDLEGIEQYHTPLWKTPVACLLGLIPNPLELLLELVSNNKLKDHSVSCTSYELQSIAVHGLLTLPLPWGEQYALTQKLFESISPANQRALLNLVAQKRPPLAKSIASWLSDQVLQHAQNYLDDPGLDHLENLITLTHQAELHRSAGQLGQSLRLFDKALKLTQYLHADYSARWAATASQAIQNPDLKPAISHADILAIWETSQLHKSQNDLPDVTSPYNLAISQALIQAGNPVEINRWMSVTGNQTGTDQNAVPSPILIALAQHFVQTSEPEQARNLSLHLAQRYQAVEPSDPQRDRLADTYGVESSSRLDEMLAVSELLIQLDLGEQAIKLYEEALIERPSDAGLMLRLGITYLIAGRLAEALQTLELATMLQPEALEIRRALADCLAQMENHEDALSQWEYIYTMRDRSPSGVDNKTEDGLNLAACAILNGKTNRALEVCQDILQNDVSNWQAHYLFGKAARLENDLPGSLKSLQNATQLAPAQSEPWLELAQVFRSLNQPEQILSTLRTAAQASPYSALIHFELGNALLTENGLTAASVSLRQAYNLAKSPQFEKNPRQADLVFIQIADKLGETLRRLGFLTDSKEILESAMSRIGDSTAHSFTDYRYNYAQTLLALGEKESALPVLSMVVAAQPVSIQPYLDYGKTILDTGGDAAEAIQALLHVRENQPGNFEALAYLAEAYEACKFYPQAIETYLQAMETDLYNDKSWQERICFGLGRSNLALGRPDQAVAALQDALQANPRNPSIYKTLAEAYWASNLTSDGWIAAKSVVQLDPSSSQNLIWFSDHIITNYPYSTRKYTITGNKSKQIDTVPLQMVAHYQQDTLIHDALQVFEHHQPYHKLPAAMIVRLGQLQALTGDSTAAIENLHQVIRSDSPTVPDLQAAANTLRHLNDFSGAILALEHAQSLAGSEPGEVQINLMKDLVKAYMASQNPQAAQDMLQKAIQLSSTDETLFQTLASIEIQSGNLDQAHKTLASGIENCTRPANMITLLYWIARLEQRTGNFAIALTHTTTALAMLSKLPLHAGLVLSGYELRNLATQLSRSLLDHQSAAQFTADLPEKVIPGGTAKSLQALAECYYSSIEMALDHSDRVKAGSLFNIVQKIIPEEIVKPPRFYAILARILNRQTSENAATQAFQTCLEQINNWETNQPHKLSLIEPAWEDPGYDMLEVLLPNSKPFEYLASIAAALELREWEALKQLVNQAHQLFPNHPAFIFAEIQVLITETELSQLCQELEIIAHQPAQRLAASEVLEKLQTLVSDNERSLWSASQEIGLQPSKGSDTQIPGQLEINRWKLRGMAACQKQDQVSSNPFTSMSLEQKILLAIQIHKSNPTQAFQMVSELAQDCSEEFSRGNNAIRKAGLAFLARDRDNNETALLAVLEALTYWPEEPRWHSLAAKLLITQPDSYDAAQVQAEALDHLENAIQLEPGNADHYMALAKTLARPLDQLPGNIEKVIQVLERGMRNLPDNPYIRVELAKQYVQLKTASDMDQAARLIDEALMLFKENNIPEPGPEPRLLKAEIALRRHNPHEAYLQTSAIRKSYPRDPKALLIHVHALEAIGKVGEALIELDKETEVVNSSKDLQLIRAFMLGKHDQQAKIIEFKQLAKKFADDFEIHYALAEALFLNNTIDEAIQIAQAALQNTKVQDHTAHKASFHFLLGKMLNQIGQLDQAIFHLSQAISVKPHHIDAYIELGNVYRRQRQFKKAQKTYQTAIQAAPNDSRPYVQAAIAYKEGKDYRNAEDMLRKAVELAPQDVSIRKQLAAIVAINLVQNPNPIQYHTNL
jgi:tetratricopeptide (TPR) repeat protein